ncbi:hypothetical protein CSA56_14935 [candidate division KSB3 bacterium]|uniref:Uncharacterized protein n=1 Tax=candidate division KSB3 bacterium TaxID=2044937 RepID=A0A2G6KCR2_9BACT|nr:MAG: hypothetical protein CSA56_14935 [candidate division KSB3 bacterium]
MNDEHAIKILYMIFNQSNIIKQAIANIYSGKVFCKQFSEMIFFIIYPYHIEMRRRDNRRK